MIQYSNAQPVRNHGSLLVLSILFFISIELIFLPRISHGAPLQTNTIPDVETFVLSKDRKAFLDRLVPGSEDEFYFRSIHAQNTGDLETVNKILPEWRNKYGETGRWISIRNRQAVLNFKFQPDASAEIFQSVLGLHFGHQRRIPPAEKALPSSLEQNLISRETLVRRWIDSNQLDKLTYQSLYDQAQYFLNCNDQNKIRFLLGQLQTPDYPQLVKLVVAELKSSHSGGFGSLGIHSALTLEQLHECRKDHPDLANNANWVFQVVQRMHGESVPLPDLYSSRLKEFKEIWEFVRPLPVSQNSLKAAVLHEILSLQLKSDELDKDLFVEYLKLPHRLGWVHPVRLERSAATPGGLIDNDANFNAALKGCLPNQADNLVATGLQIFLRDPGELKTFEPLVEENFLNRQLAIAQVLAGAGDNARWSAILSPAGYRDLVERVDLAFHTESKTWYAPDEAVSLKLKVKNIKELVIRIYELNTLNCYRNGGNVEADVSLEGLVANHERKITRDKHPALQTVETIDFPELKGRGLYVLDFIGGGKNCRALIHKGRLVHVAQMNRRGQSIMILNEEGKTCKPSAVWVGGRRFTSDEDGKIQVPFSEASQQTQILLEHSDFASPGLLSQVQESWTLEMGTHIDRENLLPGATARLLIRPMLRVSGVPIPLAGTLTDITVQLSAVNQDNESAVRTYRDLKPGHDGELALDFLVPPRLKDLQLNLSGEVRVLSQNLAIRIASSKSLSINGIADTDQIVCPQLIRDADKYFVDILGRNGESLPAHPVTIELFSRWSKEPVRVEMQSNGKGQVELGELLGVNEIKVQINGANVQQWNLTHQSHQSTTPVLTLPSNSKFTIPLPTWVVDSQKEQRAQIFQKKNGQFLNEIKDVATIKNGNVELKGLDAGDYQLSVQGEPYSMALLSVDGTRVNGHLVNPISATEVADASLLRISEVAKHDDRLKVKIHGATESTRVHILGTRYIPRYSAGINFDNFQQRTPHRKTFGWHGNRFVSARQLGDEYLYILSRKTARNLPGNMLFRPSELMTPWSLGPTDTQQESLKMDDPMSAGRGASDAPAVSMPSKAPGAPAGENAPGSDNYRDFGSFDFLDQGTVVLENLEVDKEGNVSVPIAALKGKHHLTVVAVDLFGTSQRTIALTPAELKTRDQRIDHALAKDGHFSMQKKTFILKAGETFVLENMLTGKFETISDLKQVWRSLIATTSDPQLAHFEFLTRWSEIKDVERRKLYDEHACHEFNFWLYRKDKKFFEEVVVPVIQNRHEPTFMDCWFLENDLSAWSSPWRFEQLNTFEQILLAQRVPEMRDGILRRMKEQFEMLPPDEVSLNMLFDTTLASGLLSNRETRSLEFLRGGEIPLNGESAGALDQVKRKQMRGGGLGDKDSRGKPSDNKADKGWAKREAQSEGEGGEEESVELLSMDFEDRFDRRLSEKKLARFYQSIKPTERWAEAGWYRIPQTTSTHERIPLNRFWFDLAHQKENDKFVNASFGLCRANLSDSILALAVLDLPETAEEGKTEVDGNSIKWTSTSPAIVFHQQVAAQDLNRGELMVSENFFDPADRHQLVNNRTADKFITSPFFTGKLYGGQVVVTNPTSTPQSANLLIQIPAGSIAVNKSHPTRSQPIELGPFQSVSVEYWFYFPESGKLDHFPAHVSNSTGILAHGNPVTLDVIAERGELNQATWEHISQNGTVDQVLDWLKKNNLRKTDLEQIAFRMKDKPVYDQILKLLSENRIYHRTLWSYAVNHRDPKRLGELLENEDAFLQTCRPALDSELLTIRPETRRWYEHVEFWPLVNSRAHQVGSQRRILNNQLYNQYVELLNILSCRRELSGDDQMAVVCYLLMQDRVEEAIELFGSVNREQVAGKMQYDYAAAWLAMSQSRPDQANQIALRYLKASPERWRARFEAITVQVAELKGEKVKVVDADNTAQTQDQLASDMASLDVTLEGNKLNISCRNASEVTIHYFPIDVELMFSRDPFAQESKSSQGIVKPKLVETLAVKSKENQLIHQVPESLGNQNLLLEIRSGEEIRTVRRLANQIDVQIATAMGQLQARKRGSDDFLTATYVKVYARRNNGQVVFWKDGYTDLRGKFDYATQSVQSLDGVEEFAIFVFDEKEGCLTKTAKPPQR